MVIMWNKLSLRIKITALTAMTLTLMCVCLTVMSVLSTDVFYDPIAYVLDKKPIDETFESVGNAIHSGGIEKLNAVDEIFIGSRNQFKAISIFTSFGIIIFGAFLSYIVAGKALQSLKAFTGRVMEIDENNLNGQIALPTARDEVSDLTETFNHMLEKLDRAFESKKLFAANVAHELKTPLTTVLTNIEVLQMDDTPGFDEYKEVMGITKENIERLTTLVSDLLCFNADLDDEGFEELRTDSIFEKIVTDLSVIIREKNINVSIEGSLVIKGDKTLLERAFFNIIENAVKYNRENGEIKITAHDKTICIEDSGIGIPDDSISHIFDPFYCVDKSRSRSLGGSGLGLGIAKQIFDKHGMKITVSSHLNEGTKIFLKG